MTRATTTTPRTPSKRTAVIEMMRRKEGATIDELTAATGWQPHSARAILSGLRKQGHVISRSKRGERTCYRITEQA